MGEKRNKPTPYKWHCNEHGVVEYYDFQLWKRSDPPPIDADPVILKIKKEPA